MVWFRWLLSRLCVLYTIHFLSQDYICVWYHQTVPAISFKKFNIFIKFLFIGVATVILCSITAIVFSPFIQKSVTLQLGEQASETMVSPRHIEFESQFDINTNRQKYNSIKEKTGKVYQIDNTVNSTIKQNIGFLV